MATMCMGSIHMRLIEVFDINHNAIILGEFQRGDEPQGFVGSNAVVDELMVQEFVIQLIDLP